MNNKMKLLSSAVVHDVMVYDMHYKEHFMLSNDIKLLTGKPVSGRAFTVRGEFTFNRLADYEELARVIDMLPHFTKGDIEVLQPGYGGPLGTWGGFTAKLVAKYGCRGAVVDGYTRDIGQLQQMEFSVFCKGTNLINGFGSGWQIVDFQSPIDMPGLLGTTVSVRPGDFIVGDEDGVVVVPTELLEEVVDHAHKRLAREDELGALLDEDTLSLAEWKKTIFDW